MARPSHSPRLAPRERCWTTARPVFRTIDGTSWTGLPDCRQGVSGNPVCRASTVRVSESTECEIWEAGRSCWTSPTIPTTRATSTARPSFKRSPDPLDARWAGRPIFGDYGTTTKYVTLSASGGHATVKLQFFSPGKTPSSGCHKIAVKGVTATFGPGSVSTCPCRKQLLCAIRVGPCSPFPSNKRRRR